MDENTKKMADLLRSGYTMLNMACPLCNNPLFKNIEDDIFCPICNRRVQIVKEDNKTSATKSQEANGLNSETKKTLKDASKNLEEILLKKIEYISQKLQDETQINAIKSYIEILDLIITLISKLRY